MFARYVLRVNHSICQSFHPSVLRVNHSICTLTLPVSRFSTTCGVNFGCSASVSSMTRPNGDTQETVVSSEVFQRLPESVKPSHYDLHLKPNLTDFTFTGDVSIALNVLEQTRELKFHAEELTVDKADFEFGGKVHSSLPVVYNKKWHHATLTLPEAVTPGSGVLRLAFTGILNDQNTGFYRSKYEGANGEEKYMGTTQFESSHARQAFPCWDEPMYKATFGVAMTVPDNTTALSCMPQISEVKNGDGTKTVKFDKTPVMSTYIMAFVVGELEYIEGKTRDGVDVKVYTLPGKKDQGSFALEVALKAIPFYSDFFGIPYVLPKCDLIAIPDFVMGAMENWGLVTYREVCLLTDPKHSSVSQKQYVAIVVAHELSHMWFGNLATMEWWTDLWLKEGYATFLESYMVNKFYPEFDIWTDFINNCTLGAMSLDALKNSHPIEVPINDPCEIDEIYDSISYDKAGSIIRMLHSYIGDEAFQKCSSAYLSKYQFKNATTQDLWGVFSEVSGHNVAQLLGDWTQRQGFPVIKSKAWQIPLTIITGKDPDNVTRALFADKKMDLTLEGVESNHWVKLNSGFSGVYRVEYSDDMLNELMAPVKEKTLSTIDRFNIVADLFALVRAGRCSVNQFLEFALSLREETELFVWAEITSGISLLRNLLQRTDTLESFDAFTRSLYKSIGDKLGWEAEPGENQNVSRLRPLVLKRLGVAGDVATIEEALKRFDAHVTQGKEIEANVRGVVYSLAVKHRNESAFDALVQIMESTNFPEVKTNCISSFCQAKDVNVINKALAYGIEKGKVRSQDIPQLFSGMVSSLQGQDMAWDYVKANLNKFKELYGENLDKMTFRNIAELAISYHCSEAKAKDIEDFYHRLMKGPALERPVSQSVERVRLNATLLDREKGNIAQWLAAKGF